MWLSLHMKSSGKNNTANRQSRLGGFYVLELLPVLFSFQWLLCKKCMAKKTCTRVAEITSPMLPYTKSHGTLRACYLQLQRVAPNLLKMWCPWGLIKAHATQKRIPRHGAHQTSGTHIFWATRGGVRWVGAGTHPHNHHLHRHVLRQPDGSSEMHGQSHQKVQDGNQILAMDGCREKGKWSKRHWAVILNQQL